MTISPETAQLVRTVPEALRSAASTSRGITLVDRDLAETCVSFADLASDSARVARVLRDRGVTPGDRVCILSPTNADLVAMLFGVWEAGAVPVVLSLPRRLSDLDAFVEDVVSRTHRADAILLVVSTMLLEMAPPIDVAAQIVAIEEIVGRDGPAFEPLVISPDDLAYLQFTSGTTARSRAVALTHRHLLANMQAAGEMAGMDPSTDVFVSWLPLFHDMGLIGMLLGSVIFGADLVLIPTEEFLGRPGVWVDAMSKYHGTITASPNFGYGLAARDLTARARDLDLSGWRIAANGAEPIDVETCDKFCDAAAIYGFHRNAMAPMFGLAEATLAVSLSRTDEPVLVEWVDRDALETEQRVVTAVADANGARALVACGHPIPGHEVAIKDVDGATLDADRVGEICFRGPSVMQGYWRDPEATREAIRDGWLHTGDLGFVGEHGLVVCGRKKDMIILGGRNLYPEDYELFTERVPGVRRGNVIAFALHDIERMVVVAETTALAEEAQAIARAALEQLRRSLPRGPEEVVLVSPGTLPKTSSGKRQRGACRERYTAGELEPVAVAKR
jgi:fatty-acyl-CoA synthase